jgi:hypothetical protein
MLRTAQVADRQQLLVALFAKGDRWSAPASVVVHGARPATGLPAGRSTVAERIACRRARGLVIAVRSVLAITAVSFALAACGGETRTVTEPARTAPLGRAIGPDRPTLSGVDTKARAAARAFLASYLSVSYGRAKPDKLRSASQALRERLAAQQARVPAGVRHRRPQIVALRLEAVGGGRVRATATIDDGDVAPYPLFATLARERRGGRWVAVSVGG